MKTYFKKVSVVPDGKNHGLVFILDWSGSMNNVMMDTLKQLYNLIWFCRKVQIPYDVYALQMIILDLRCMQIERLSMNQRI